MRNLLLIVILLYLSSLLFSAPGDLLWKFQTGNEIWSSPRVSEGVVFVGSNDEYLYAINCSDGTVKWSYWGVRPIYCTPCIDKNMIYSLIYWWDLEMLVAINKENGNEEWDIGLSGYDGNYTSPCYDKGMIFTMTADGYLCAINTTDRTKKWKYQIHSNYSSPCVSDGVIYVGSMDHYLYAINSSDGTLKWRYKTGSGASSPCVSDGVVYNGMGDVEFGYLYAINCSDGTFRWRYKTDEEIFLSSPYVSNEVVYIGSMDHYLYAINCSDGTLKWRFQTDGSIGSSPCVSDGVVYVGSADYLYAINCSDGSLKWRYQTGTSITYSSPCISNGVVYIGSCDNYLYAIETYGYKGFKNNKSASSLPSPSLSMYPNPFSSRLSLSLPSSGAVYSITGQLVMNLVKGKHSLDTSKWREGVYIVKSGKECKRVVKVNNYRR